MASKRVDKKDLKEFAEYLKTNANILKRETSYIAGAVVNKGQIVLKCTTAGTTDSTVLDLSGVSVGDTLTDGTVEWEVISITGYGSGSGGGTTIADWTANATIEPNNDHLTTSSTLTSKSRFIDVRITPIYVINPTAPIVTKYCIYSLCALLV